MLDFDFFRQRRKTRFLLFEFFSITGFRCGFFYLSVEQILLKITVELQKDFLLSFEKFLLFRVCKIGLGRVVYITDYFWFVRKKNQIEFLLLKKKIKIGDCFEKKITFLLFTNNFLASS